MVQKVNSFVMPIEKAVCLLLSFLILLHSKTTAQEKAGTSKSAQDIRTLELGKPIERELRRGEGHTYQVPIASDQYLHLFVDQKGVDVTVTLSDSIGRILLEVNSQSSTHGVEPISMLTKVAGIYQVNVQASKKDSSSGRYEIIIDALRQAVPEDSSRIAGEKAFGEAEELRLQQTSESLQKAIEKFEEALVYWRAVKDSTGQGDTLNNLGIVYRWLGKIQQALNVYLQALALRRAVHDSLGEAQTLNNIGLVYDRSGEKRKALEYYALSLPLRRAFRDTSGEGATLYNIGLVYDDLGEKQMALDYYHQALPLWRAAGHRRGVARTLNNLGAVYNSLNDQRSALAYYEQALPLIKAEGDRSTEATVLSNIGSVYLSIGERQKALNFLNRALAISERTGDTYGKGYILTEIGKIYRSLQEPKKAIEYFEKALSLRRSVSDRRGEAITLGELGLIYGTMGDKERALDYLNQALAIDRKITDRLGESQILVGMAAVERSRGNLGEAQRYIAAALDTIESVRTKVISQALRVAYFASAKKIYDFYIDLLMEQQSKNPQQAFVVAAFEVSERSRARVLLEMIHEIRANIRHGVDTILLEQERKLKETITTKANKLASLVSQQYTDENAEAANKEIDALFLQYQNIQAKIRATSPRYTALTQPQPLSLKEIQEQMLDNDTMLLEYALGEKRSFLWAVTPTSINSFELPKRAEIDSLARRMYDLLTARSQVLLDETKTQKSARIAQADAELPKVAAALSQMLLGPAAELLGNKRLLIVSDGALQYIPFGALPIPDDQLSVTSDQSPVKEYRPLITAHEIVSLPSASVLAVLRRELADRKPAAKAVAVLADPVFAKSDPRIKTKKKAKADTTDTSNEQSALLRSAREMGVAFSRLVYSRREAEAIMKLVPAGEGKRAVDFEANRETATGADLSQYRMVHFATHGLLNSEHPELSGIVLSLVNENGEERDGFLRLHEIYNLNLPADLVVLSACQTALGKEIKGEGLIGLTRGFMYAGAARVVASLWSVGDVATAELMKRFYTKMLEKEQLRPAAALRAAQIEMWKSKRWASPYYWAGFLFQGEWK